MPWSRVLAAFYVKKNTSADRRLAHCLILFPLALLLCPRAHAQAVEMLRTSLPEALAVPPKSTTELQAVTARSAAADRPDCPRPKGVKAVSQRCQRSVPICSSREST